MQSKRKIWKNVDYVEKNLYIALKRSSIRAEAVNAENSKGGRRKRRRVYL